MKALELGGRRQVEREDIDAIQLNADEDSVQPRLESDELKPDYATSLTSTTSKY